MGEKGNYLIGEAEETGYSLRKLNPDKNVNS